MIFWMGILAGGLFTWLALKMGFYEMWALLFNIVISIYVGIFVAPMILDLVPSASDTPYANALALIVAAGGTFLILYGITYIFFTSQFKITLPKLFDLLFAGFLGFLTGFLVLSFIALIITSTPISQSRIANKIGVNKESQQANISYICWWCDLVNSIVSSDEEVTSKEAILQLLSSTQPKVPNGTQQRVDPNESVKSTEVEADSTGASPPLSPAEPNLSTSEDER